MQVKVCLDMIKQDVVFLTPTEYGNRDACRAYSCARPRIYGEGTGTAGQAIEVYMAG